MGSRGRIPASKIRATNLDTNHDDDWETDPDFVRDMDEIDQRWGGARRTAGSINMNELIDEVRKDHQILRDKFSHPSQRDHSEGFGGKFGVQRDRVDKSAVDYDYHEKLSKHTSQEIRKVVTSTSSSLLSQGGSDRNGFTEARRAFMDRAEGSSSGNGGSNTRQPPTAPRPQVPTKARVRVTNVRSVLERPTFSPIDADDDDVDTAEESIREEKTSSKRIVREESSFGNKQDVPASSFKSIQEKIDAFKKEFEELENRVAKKSDFSKAIKRTTTTSASEREPNVNYVTRTSAATTSPKPTTTCSTTRLSPNAAPANIKSLSEKFESMSREDSEQFRKRTEAKRKEFFDEIKSQVRATRKELDGFDNVEDECVDDNNVGETRPRQRERMDDIDELERKLREKLDAFGSPSGSRGSSRLGHSATSPGSSMLSSAASKPRVYTRSETSKEEIVSRIVKENDKIVANETKRNVERSSSCHGSSDDDDDRSSVKYIGVRTDSPASVSRTKSPQQHPAQPSPQPARQSPLSPASKARAAGLMARTLYDYQAAEDDELSFDVDELITNIEKLDAGWYKGTMTNDRGDKRVGLFPANYVRLLNESDEY